MKNLLLAWGTATLLVLAAAPAGAAGPDSRTGGGAGTPAGPVDGGKAAAGAQQERIWSLEQAYFEALYRADYDAVLALVHRDFLGWPDGQDLPLDRAGSDAFMRRLIVRPVEARIDIERKGIRIDGDTALTQSIVVARVGGSARRSRVSHTWRQDGTDWKLLGGMSRDLPASPTEYPLDSAAPSAMMGN